MSHYGSTIAAMAARQNAEQIADVDLDDPAMAELAEQAIDAAIADDPAEFLAPETVKLPDVDVGTRVVYITRSGHGRMGRSEFPADVLHVNQDDGSVSLFVIMEAEDLMTEDRVHAQINPDDRHCWRHVRQSGQDVVAAPAAVPAADLSESVNALANLIHELADQVVVMKDQMFGEFVAPNKSMMDYLADFDARIRAMEHAAPIATVAPKKRGRPKKG